MSDDDGARPRSVTLAVCPTCAGQGHDLTADYKLTPCWRCGGTGDLDAARLAEAYRLGRASGMEPALATLAELERMIALARETLSEPSRVDGRELRRRVGS